MVTLVIKNLKEVEEAYRNEIENTCQEKLDFYQNLFKKYDKDLKLEVIFNTSERIYSVSASLDMRSKKVLVAEEDKEVLKAFHRLCSEFKKVVKRQYELERKDYEYKRKNRK